MKHEDFFPMYNEIMFSERDVIVGFLERQADLRYGNQMYEWHFEPAVRLIGIYGCEIAVTDAHLDKNKFVTFTGVWGTERNDDYECTDFAYGELSKIIDALPDADDFVLKNAENDLVILSRDYNTDAILKESPFKWEDKKSTFEVLSVVIEKDGKVNYEIHETIDGLDAGFGLWEDGIPADVAKALADHLKTQVLRCSFEYKLLKKRLGRFANNVFNFVEHGQAGKIVVFPHGTDLSLDVLDVSFEYGELIILVSIAGTRIAEQKRDDTMTLHEKDLTPSNLEAICAFFDDDDAASKVALTDEQESLVREFKDVLQRLSDGGVGIVLDKEDESLLFLNMKQVGDISCYKHIPDGKDFTDITDFLSEPVTDLSDVSFWSGSDRILVNFTE